MLLHRPTGKLPDPVLTPPPRNEFDREAAAEQVWDVLKPLEKLRQEAAERVGPRGRMRDPVAARVCELVQILVEEHLDEILEDEWLVELLAARQAEEEGQPEAD